MLALRILLAPFDPRVPKRQGVANEAPLPSRSGLRHLGPVPSLRADRRPGLGRSGARLRRTAAQALRLQKGESVIDIGTGTGLTLPYLAAGVGPTGRVVGLDRSASMLDGARDRAPSPPVELR